MVLRRIPARARRVAELERAAGTARTVGQARAAAARIAALLGEAAAEAGG